MTLTLLVTDKPKLFESVSSIPVVSFETYISEYPKLDEPKTRIMNVCDVDTYLSKGYYGSLLAEARRHSVIPRVNTINDIRNLLDQTHSRLEFNLPTDWLKQAKIGDSVTLNMYFGWVSDPAWRAFAKTVFNLYPVPLIRIDVIYETSNPIVKLNFLSVSELSPDEEQDFLNCLESYAAKNWRRVSFKQHYRWDLAILVNPEETHPPSDVMAIKGFIKEAKRIGIRADVILPHQLDQIMEYDALFIRETTAIDHHTYKIARKAEKAGLVVIDDSTSILRCCNKVFLHDAFNYNHVPSLKTRVLYRCEAKEIAELESEFTYPMILKMPESSFSKGVFKAKNRQELELKCQELLVQSAVILVQEYLFTEYDWRIGILAGRPLYACKYFMAPSHWQIYNHTTKRSRAGHFETLPTYEVPKPVLEAALKASAIIGNGLYGIDIKYHENKAYVIEVNDNPSLEHGVEDLFLGKSLYAAIMEEFANRLEKRGR